MQPVSEATTLLAYLDSQRRHILGIVDGLDEDALLRPVLPSGWTCASLIHHLAVDVERFWFRAVFAAEPETIAWFADSGDAWQLPAGTSGAAALDLYRHETALASGIIAAAEPQTPPAWWPDGLFGSYRLDNLREVLLHVMVETATHAGHLDAARELIDGRQWRVMP
jgi:hypothetical protein